MPRRQDPPPSTEPNAGNEALAAAIHEAAAAMARVTLPQRGQSLGRPCVMPDPGPRGARSASSAPRSGR